MIFYLCTRVWIFLGNEEVRERGDEEVELARRRNNKVRGFTQFLTHKSTLLGTYIKAQFSQLARARGRRRRHERNPAQRVDVRHGCAR